MRLFGFVFELFKSGENDQLRIRDAGAATADLFWDGFGDRMTERMRTASLDLTGRTPDQLVVETNGDNEAEGISEENGNGKIIDVEVAPKVDAKLEARYSRWKRPRLVKTANKAGVENVRSLTKEQLVKELSSR